MNILVLSPDEDAGRSLCAALARSGQAASWQQSLESARSALQNETPMVVVADVAMDDHIRVVNELCRDSPWTRIYLMAEPGQSPATSSLPVIPKPFDASEVAAHLGRECELAELERGRARLQAHVDELALLVEECFEAIIGLEADGTIRSWNRGAQNLYGYEPNEVLGRHVNLLEIDASALDERLRSGSGPAQEVRRRRKDGKTVVVMLSLSPVGRLRQSRLSFAEVSLDITQRRQLEHELEHSERLAALGRIAATMAHEINNPLSVIRASASYMRDLSLQIGDNDLGECATDLDLAVERIGSFVQHVCGFARRERPELSEGPMATAVEMALRLVKPRARESNVTIKVASTFLDQAPNDPARLAQALVNLLSNSIDAATSGGQNVWISSQVAEHTVSIIVEDDGPGIPAELGENVFEPFSTTKPHGKGTGLGLAITRKIVDDHHGSITLEPREGGGTRATVKLPTLITSQHEIVVLDSDPLVRRALATELRREGFNVFSAASLAEACDLLKQHTVSLIITDYVVGDQEGQELLNALTEGSPHSSLLLVTADAPAPDLQGAHQVLTRPWDRTQLIDATRRLCVRASATTLDAGCLRADAS